MYSFDSRIRYSEVDNTGNLTFHALLDYFQDCSIFHSEDYGVGIAYLKEKQLAWVLISWQVEIARYPRIGECVRISTWPYDFKGFYGWRNFTMTDEAGNRLAWASSLWALLDTAAGRPVKLPQEMAEAYVLSPALPMEQGERKMKLPQDMTGREPFTVHKFHLDTNQHVNNGKYILMAQEYLPEGFCIGRMRAEYKKSAVYGDTIYPAVKTEDAKTVVVLGDEAGKPFVIMELEEKND